MLHNLTSRNSTLRNFTLQNFTLQNITLQNSYVTKVYVDMLLVSLKIKLIIIILIQGISDAKVNLGGLSAARLFMLYDIYLVAFTSENITRV